MGILGAAIPSSNPFVWGKPQMKTIMLRIIQGCQALNTSNFEYCNLSEARASARASVESALPDGRASDTPTSSSPTSTRSLPLPVLTSNRQMRFGCQNFKNVASEAIETIAATTSTNHGPWKLDTRNCGIAKHAPATKMAGQISSMPRKPANAHINQNGTISEKNGSWRPTIALNCLRSSPVTPCRPIKGAPKAPNATGAVFAINERPEADSGVNPSPIKIAPVTATGVPNPQAPSMKAPKLNATSSNCRRRSSVRPVTLCRKRSKSPHSFVN